MAERSIIRTTHFGNRTTQALLYQLRDFNLHQYYRDRGFPSLEAWAKTSMIGVASKDKIGRLVSATERVIAVLDSSPSITPDGEKITGLSVIASASASALMRTAGTFAESTNGERDLLVQGLMTGSSDDRYLKGLTGWKPKIGKAQGVITQLEDDLVDIHIRGTSKQARAIEGGIEWVVEWRLTDGNLDESIIRGTAVRHNQAGD